jgi:uncharacterized protein YkwD
MSADAGTANPQGRHGGPPWTEEHVRPIAVWQLVAAGLVVLGLAFVATRPAAEREAYRRAAMPVVPTVQPAPGPNLGGASPRQREGLASSLSSAQAQELEEEFRRGYSAFGPSPSLRGQPVSLSRPRVRMVSQLDVPAPEAPEVLRAEWRMLSVLNDERMRNGLAPLAPDDTLANVARWRSDDMASRNYFSHDIGGYLVFSVLRDTGYSYRTAGENLAYNYYTEDRSVSEAHAALLRSPSHRENMLRPDFTHAGIGVAVVADGRRIYTQLFSTPYAQMPQKPAPPPAPPTLEVEPLAVPVNLLVPRI